MPIMTDLLDPPLEDERPRIDPRFARRWIDARREEGRRRLHYLFGLGVVAAVAALVGGSLYSPLFHIRHLRITVNGPISTSAISRLAGLSEHDLMIEVNSSRSVSRLDSDPWIGAARVTRRWPGTVSVVVTVRTPIAVVAAAAGSWAELDQTGRVLTDIAVPPPAMPVLQGVGAVPAQGGWLAGTAGPAIDPNAGPGRLADLTARADGADVPSGAGAELAALASLPVTLRPDIISVTAGSGRGLSLVMSPPRLAAGTVTVAFGDGSELQSKVTALVTLLGQADLAGITNLDLSVPDRPAAGTPAPSTTTTSTSSTTVPAAPTSASTTWPGSDSTPPTATTMPGSGGAGGLDGA
jgi:hypothetical protein